MGPARREIGAPGYALRVSALYAALFFVSGTMMPFFPLWLEWRGLGLEGIALVLALQPIVRTLFTPLMAGLADRLGDPRRVLVGLALAALLALSALPFAADLWPIALIAALYAATGPAMMPLSEVVALAGVRRGLDYGRMRSAGSVAFVLANLAGGAVIGIAGPKLVPALLIAGALLLLWSTLVLQPLGPPASTAPVGRADATRGALGLLATPLFALFLLAAALINVSHAVFYAFGTLHWQAQGIGATLAGLLWAIGVGAEIVLFLFSRPVIERLGPLHLIVIAAGGAVVRWTAMAFDPPVALLPLLQALHGATFGAAHLGAMHFLARAVPETRIATAQGLYSATVAGIAMGAATLLSGQLYHAAGGRAYLAMAGCALIGTLCALALCRLWDGGRLAGDGRPGAAT